MSILQNTRFFSEEERSSVRLEVFKELQEKKDQDARNANGSYFFKTTFSEFWPIFIVIIMVVAALFLNKKNKRK